MANWYQMIVFDMDGVLVNVTGSYREAVRATVAHYTGREVTHPEIQDYKNQGGWNNDWALSQRIIKDFGIDVEYDAVVETFNRLFLGENGDGLIRNEKWIAGDGLLTRLAERYRFAIFTGRLRVEAMITLGRFADGLIFDPLITDDDVEQPKPAPDGLLQIAERFPALRLVYVGDTVDDARAARDAGVPFIGIAEPGNPRHAELQSLLRSEGALAVLDDINSLEQVL